MPLEGGGASPADLFTTWTVSEGTPIQYVAKFWTKVELKSIIEKILVFFLIYSVLKWEGLIWNERGCHLLLKMGTFDFVKVQQGSLNFSFVFSFFIINESQRFTNILNSARFCTTCISVKSHFFEAVIYSMVFEFYVTSTYMYGVFILLKLTEDG